MGQSRGIEFPGDETEPCRCKINCGQWGSETEDQTKKYQLTTSEVLPDPTSRQKWVILIKFK